MERSARQLVEWKEIGPVPPLDAWDPVRDAVELAERRERSLKKSAQRAKQRCRRLIISEGFDELLTLTYRKTMLDRAQCKRDFKEWVRRMRAALPSFRYCGSFERQTKRGTKEGNLGSMHVHLATHKLAKHVQYKGVKIESWKLGTAVWRSVVGPDNGMCHVGGKTRHGGRRRNLSLAKMASYVSKYILKDFADSPLGSNRFSSSVGADVPKSEILRLVRCSYLDLIHLTFEQGEGDVLISHRLGRFQDVLWLCTENRSVLNRSIHRMK